LQRELDGFKGGKTSIKTSMKTFFKNTNELRSYSDNLQGQIEKLLEEERTYFKISVVIDKVLTE